LYGLKHSRLCFHFWHVQFLACSSHWLERTSLKRLTHSFCVVIRHTRSTRTPAFTQASTFHKLSVPSGYIILVCCVFFKPCTKLTLHCSHRYGHLKTEHKEPSPAETPFWKLVPRPQSAWETRTVPASDSVYCARVGREMKFLLIFETALFFCVCSVWILFSSLFPAYFVIGARGSVVVTALCYKLEGRGFETRCGEFF
jgi:hypothetical protein